MTSFSTKRFLAIAALALLLPGLVLAQQQSTDGPYVLHEQVEEIRLGEGDLGDGAEPNAAQPPEPTFVSGQPPALSLEARHGEPIYDRNGPVFDREIPQPYGDLSPYASANTLDSHTDRVDSLTYFSNFDPSVIPYKRVVAKNHATKRGEQYAVGVQTGPMRQVATAPANPGDTLFWGTFLLRMERGRPHPLASVAPDQRIVQWAVEPEANLQFMRDDADNYFVTSTFDGLVRLNVQVAVEPFYFGGPFPEVHWADFPSGLVPQMEPTPLIRSRQLATQLGFTTERSPRETVLAMVEYFRDFEAKPFPPELNDGDLLVAICTAEIGVCRHRSLAFVFLAQSLGIPARYVYNEAHAFVEVYWPIGGWRRIDLGGAANELNSSAGDGRPVHDYGDDGLPTPPRYLEEQQRMQHNGWEPPGAGGASQDGATSQDGASQDGATSQDGAPVTQEGTTYAADGHGEGAEVADLDLSELMTADDERPVQPDQRARTTLTITRATSVVRRGNSIALEARLASATGQAVQGRDVDVYLGPVGSLDPRAARKLGTVRTDANGNLTANIEVPREHAIGRWVLFLHFVGDHSYQAAIAD